MTYHNQPAGHSFSGTNLTHNNRGRADHGGSAPDKMPCWNCGFTFFLRIDKIHGGLKCLNCGCSQSNKPSAGQLTLMEKWK